MITREKYHHYDESVDYESALDYNIPDMKEKLCYAIELLKDKGLLLSIIFFISSSHK